MEIEDCKIVVEADPYVILFRPFLWRVEVPRVSRWGSRLYPNMILVRGKAWNYASAEELARKSVSQYNARVKKAERKSYQKMRFGNSESWIVNFWNVHIRYRKYS